MPKNSQPIDSCEPIDSRESIKSPSHLDDAIIAYAREEGARLKSRNSEKKSFWHGWLVAQPWRSGLAVLSIAGIAVVVSLQDFRAPVNDRNLAQMAPDSAADTAIEAEPEFRQRMVREESRQSVARESRQGVATVGLTAPNQAQAGRAADNPEIEEVIVTGSFIRSSPLAAASSVAVPTSLGLALADDPVLQTRYVQLLSAVLQQGLSESPGQAEDKESQVARLLEAFNAVQDATGIVELEIRYRAARGDLAPFLLPVSLQAAMEQLEAIEFHK